MIRLTGYHDTPVPDPNNTFHHADILVSFFQVAPLFDMEFEKGLQSPRPANGFIQVIRISAKIADPLANGFSAVGQGVEPVRGQLTDHGLASGKSAFLVHKIDYFEGMIRDQLCFVYN